MDQEQEIQEVDYKSLYEQSSVELEKIKAKQNELLAETKAAKKAREEAKEHEISESRKNGEFEKLLKVSEERQKEIESRYTDLLSGIKTEKIKNASLKIASELANKPENAELLSHFLEMKIGSLADDNGNISDEIMSSLKKQFESDNKFSSLVAGRQASGGSAPGSGNVSSEVLVKTRAELMQMNSSQQHAFMAKVRAKTAQLID